MLTVDAIGRFDGIRHAFLTRRGGVSDGIYASLNCGYGSHDSRDNVTANRRRAMARLGLPDATLVTAPQVHGTNVLVIDDGADVANLPEADAMVTGRAGIALGILTADCAPILLADAVAGIVGAAHAGWRGALNGVATATVVAMERLGARRDRIAAAIGPCIARDSYEVGPEFPAPFLDQDPDTARFFTEAARAGHFHFDLAGYVGACLERLGLAAVAATGADTCADEERFFSYRRATHRGEPDFGRGLSVIAIDG